MTQVTIRGGSFDISSEFKFSGQSNWHQTTLRRPQLISPTVNSSATCLNINDFHQYRHLFFITRGYQDSKSYNWRMLKKGNKPGRISQICSHPWCHEKPEATNPYPHTHDSWKFKVILQFQGCDFTSLVICDINLKLVVIFDIFSFFQRLFFRNQGYFSEKWVIEKLGKGYLTHLKNHSPDW